MGFVRAAVDRANVADRDLATQDRRPAPRYGSHQAAVNGISENGGAKSCFDHRGHWRVAPKHGGEIPAHSFESREFWEVFSRCLAKLPEGIADAFYLRELDELTADEVQQMLEITPANLWKRLHRARVLLRECLESRWFNASSHPSRSITERSV